MSGNTIIITLKEGGNKEELEKAKQKVKDQGGKITHESKLISSFNAEFPKDAVHTLENNDHFTVEKDSTVTTQ